MTEKNQNRPRGGGGHGPMAKVEKAKDFKGTIKKLAAYIGSYKLLCKCIDCF